MQFLILVVICEASIISSALQDRCKHGICKVASTDDRQSVNWDPLESAPFAFVSPLGSSMVQKISAGFAAKVRSWLGRGRAAWSCTDNASEPPFLHL